MADYACEECGTVFPSVAAAERCADADTDADRAAMLARHRHPGD